MCTSLSSSQRKSKIKETILKLLHSKKLNTKSTQLLLKQTTNIIIKENLFLQLKQELLYHQYLNTKLKEYYSVCKDSKHLSHTNCIEAINGCSKFKSDCKDLLAIVENYDFSLENLHKDRNNIIHQSEEQIKNKIDEQHHFHKQLINLQQKVKNQEEEMNNIINKKEMLLTRKIKEGEKYDKLTQRDENKYNILKEKYETLTDKSDRYYKKYEHVLDPSLLLNDKNVAIVMIHKENKEIELNEQAMKYDCLIDQIREMKGKIDILNEVNTRNNRSLKRYLSSGRMNQKVSRNELIRNKSGVINYDISDKLTKNESIIKKSSLLNTGSKSTKGNGVRVLKKSATIFF